MSKKPEYRTKVTNQTDALNRMVKNVAIRKRMKLTQAQAAGNGTRSVFLITFDPRDKEDAFRKLELDVDAALLNVKPQDVVHLSIYSPGGPVTSYANAAAQVARLRTAMIHVTVFIDEIAASGGYMMACVGSQVVANPMAFVGSIGVVAQMPIVEDALNRVGVHFELFTAGDMKRTVVPFKNPSEPEKDAFKAKLVDLHEAFREHVQKYRPQVTTQIMDGDFFMAKDHVGTLVDELGDSHSAMIDAFAKNNVVYKITTETRKRFSLKRLFGADTLVDTLIDRFLARLFESRYTSIG